MKKFRIGVIGFAHIHINSLVKCFADLGDKVEWADAQTLNRLFLPSVTNLPQIV